MFRTWNHDHRSGSFFDLPQDATLRVRPGRPGVVLSAESGAILVTQAGDLEDHVLVPGEELRLPAGGLVVAWALEPSRLVVREAPAPVARTLEPRAAAA